METAQTTNEKPEATAEAVASRLEAAATRKTRYAFGRRMAAEYLANGSSEHGEAVKRQAYYSGDVDFWKGYADVCADAVQAELEERRRLAEQLLSVGTGALFVAALAAIFIAVVESFF